MNLYQNPSSLKRTALSFAISVIVAFTPYAVAEDVVDPISLELPASTQKEPLPLEELRTFVEVFDRIKKHYVEGVDDKTLLDNAIKGMISGLDPHSAYLGPEAFDDLQVSTSGKFGGLGIEVGMENGFLKVVAPIDGTPADAAGVQAQDIIIKLDSKSVKDIELAEAVEMMRGEPGTDIKLTIIREGSDKPLELTITRAEIKVASVKQELLEPGFGYIRITQFQTQTGTDVVSSLKRLMSDNKRPLDGIVLDLRNNPGGVLDAAVDVSDAFLSKGLIVYTEGRIANAELRFSARPDDPSAGVPLVVMINEGSASASEIVAGALQDHSRAIIVGTPSFGKGSVQTVLPLNGNKAVKLTTARYYTPNGRSIQARGIEPDIHVERGSFKTEEARSRYKEADLARHLENSEKSTEKGLVESGSNGSFSKTNLLKSDYQLYEALNILKGIKVYQLGSQAASGKVNRS